MGCGWTARGGSYAILAGVCGGHAERDAPSVRPRHAWARSYPPAAAVRVVGAIAFTDSRPISHRGGDGGGALDVVSLRFVHAAALVLLLQRDRGPCSAGDRLPLALPAAGGALRL